MWPWGKSALNENADRIFFARKNELKGDYRHMISFAWKSGGGRIFREALEDAFVS